jgi:hypothetical protein
MTKLDLSINITASSISQASLTDPSAVEIFAIMWTDEGSIIYVRIWIFDQNEKASEVMRIKGLIRP